MPASHAQEFIRAELLKEGKLNRQEIKGSEAFFENIPSFKAKSWSQNKWLMTPFSQTGAQ
jgi:hypothetical protein